MVHSVCDICRGTKRNPDTGHVCEACKGTGGHDEFTLTDLARRCGIKIVTTPGQVTAIDAESGQQATAPTVRDAIDALLLKKSGE
jgi:hypothetical protein